MIGASTGEDEFVCAEETHLTVLKTSLFFTGDGFSAYNCKGELVFRVDSYGPDIRDTGELVLMDAHGQCLLTVRRKVLIRNIFLISNTSINCSDFLLTGTQMS